MDTNTNKHAKKQTQTIVDHSIYEYRKFTFRKFQMDYFDRIGASSVNFTYYFEVY